MTRRTQILAAVVVLSAALGITHQQGWWSASEALRLLRGADARTLVAVVRTTIGFFLHVDLHLAEFAQAYGPWLYGLLFLIVFAETGLVVAPFLPGDSLLFAGGALAATGALDFPTLALLLTVAAILGDAANYAAGRFVGPRVFRHRPERTGWARLNPEHLERSRRFFERYGGKAVVLGRFAPIVRTFVPFVAGAVAMTYTRFAFFNVAGAVLWVGICMGAGYAFGHLPLVKENFGLVALGIILVSLMPAGMSLLKERMPGAGRFAPERDRTGS